MSMETFGGPSGTGTRVGQAVIIVAGVAGLVATVTTCVSTWLQAYGNVMLYGQAISDSLIGRTIENRSCSVTLYGSY